MSTDQCHSLFQINWTKGSSVSCHIYKNHNPGLGFLTLLPQGVCFLLYTTESMSFELLITVMIGILTMSLCSRLEIFIIVIVVITINVLNLIMA